MAKLEPTDKYTCRVLWSDEDEEFVGHCSELPSLSWLAPKRAEALERIVKVAWQAVIYMAVEGEAVPAPLTDRKYSGEFKLRVPAIVHRNLVIQAAEEGVSLNRIVSAALAHG